MKQLLLLLSLSLLVSCGTPTLITLEPLEHPVFEDQPSAIPDLPFTLPYYPEESLHPTLVENQTNFDLTPLLYEGLYQLDETFTPQPLLVTGNWVSEDGLLWTFALKEGVSFWDGTPLTADIVASALNEARSSQSRYATRFGEIRTIRGQEHTLEILLYSPNYNLPALLDIPISYGGGTLPQGTGAYLFASPSLLVQNPNWWGDAAALPPQIHLATIVQTSDLISTFDAGALSLLDGDLTGTNALGYSGNYQVWSYATPQLLYLGFHNGEALSNVALRQLISLAIDRDTLITNQLAGYATPTQHPIHPDSQIGQTLEPWVYDPFLALEQKEALRLPSTPLRLIFNGESREKTAIAQEIAQQLALFDLEVTLVPLAWADYLTALQRGEFDLYLAEILLSPDFDVSPLLTWGNLLNYGAYRNDALTYHLKLFQRTGHPATSHQGNEPPSETVTPEEATVESDNQREEEMPLPEIPLEEVSTEPNFFTLFQEEMPFTPLCFKDGTMLTLWGHIQSASPVADNLYYQLEDWIFGVPEGSS